MRTMLALTEASTADAPAAIALARTRGWTDALIEKHGSPAVRKALLQAAPVAKAAPVAPPQATQAPAPKARKARKPVVKADLQDLTPTNLPGTYTLTWARTGTQETLTNIRVTHLRPATATRKASVVIELGLRTGSVGIRSETCEVYVDSLRRMVQEQGKRAFARVQGLVTFIRREA